MPNSYRESPPEFASEFEAIVVIIDRIIDTTTPWQRRCIPERLAKTLRDRGVPLTLHMLGFADGLELVHKVHEHDAGLGEKAMDAAHDLELDWVIETRFMPRSGLRELLLHLAASGKIVILASAMDERVAQRAIHSKFPFVPKSQIAGRRNPGHLTEIYHLVLSEISSRHENDHILTIGHHSIEAQLEQAGRLNDDWIGIGETDGTDILDLAIQCNLTEAEASSLDRIRSQRRRVRELRKQKSLSSSELLELLKLTGGGRHTGNTEQYGFADQATGEGNIRFIRHLRRSAAERQHLLEVITIDATLLEVELRNWLIVHRDETFDPAIRMTFGNLVTRAADRGFEKGLIERLRAFNNRRNDAIHHLARGISSYQSMTDAYMEDCALIFDVEDFVLSSAPIFGSDETSY